MSQIRLRLNGSDREIPEGTSLAGLLELTGVKAEHVAVELNGNIVRRGERAAAVLVAGDVVELVTFVGGG